MESFDEIYQKDTPEFIEKSLNKLKYEEYKRYLINTDFYYARKAEIGEEVPVDVVVKRIEAREFIRANE